MGLSHFSCRKKKIVERVTQRSKAAGSKTELKDAGTLERVGNTIFAYNFLQLFQFSKPFTIHVIFYPIY